MGSSRNTSRRSADRSLTVRRTVHFGSMPSDRRRLRFESLEDRRLLAAFSVSNLSDGSVAAAGDLPGSLRQAIFDANANGEADTIGFSIIGKIDLVAQLPTITEQLTINGGGVITLDAGGASYRVFKIDDGTAALIEVELSGLHITGGNPAISDESSAGGGIFSRENLTLTGSTISGNQGSFGGGLRVNNTTTISSSTISGNSASIGGGGIWDYGTLHITSSTIAGNNAGGFGGGGIQSLGTIFLTNSIVATNASAAAVSADDDIRGTIDLSSSFNLVDSSVFDWLTNGVNGNIVGFDPLLSPLTDSGGLLPTHSLGPDSPAIDAGDDSVSDSTDQRGNGYVRNFGNGVDMGAYERQTLVGLSLVVDTLSDLSDNDYSAGNLSLREAISLANSSAGADTITFSTLFDNPQTIDLGSQLPTVIDHLTIDTTDRRVTLDAGGGASANAGDGFRILRIATD